MSFGRTKHYINADNNNVYLDEISVTSTGFEQALKDEIGNVYILNKEDFANKGYKDVKEVLESMPGINFANESEGIKLDLRGQGDQKANNNVKIMIDGIEQNSLSRWYTAGMDVALPLNSIERIEVIPGGGAVLYGSGTVGGVVNIITKSKIDETIFNLGTRFDTFKSKNLDLGGDVKINENLGLRLSSNLKDSKGYRKGFKIKGDGFNLGFLGNIDDIHNFDLKLAYSKYSKREPGSIDELQYAKDPKQIGRWLNTSWDARNSYSLSYQNKAIENLTADISTFYQTNKKYMELLENKEDYFTSYRHGNYKDTKYGLKLKGKYNFQDAYIISGADFSHNGFKAKDSWVNSIYSKDIYSAYILGNYYFNDIFSIIPGYRFERTNNKVEVREKNEIVQDGKTISSIDGAFKNKKQNLINNAFSLSFNAKYSDSGNIYAKFEKGYSSPIPDELFDYIRTKKSVLGEKINVKINYKENELKPELYNTYEIGFRDYFHNSFINFALFETITKNEIIHYWPNSEVEPFTDTLYKNEGKTLRRGFEISSQQWFFDEALSFNENLSYIHARVKGGVNDGAELRKNPALKVNFLANYEFLDKTNVFLRYRYEAKNETFYDGIYIKAYDLVHIGINKTFKNGLYTGVGINNLFNKTYYKEYGMVYGLKAFNIGDKRNLYAEFKYDF